MLIEIADEGILLEYDESLPESNIRITDWGGSPLTEEAVMMHLRKTWEDFVGGLAAPSQQKVAVVDTGCFGEDYTVYSYGWTYTPPAQPPTRSSGERRYLRKMARQRDEDPYQIKYATRFE